MSGLSKVDRDEMLSPQPSADMAVHDTLFNIGERMGKPLIAAVQGAAHAGGMALVANAHVVVAAQGRVRLSRPKPARAIPQCVLNGSPYPVSLMRQWMIEVIPYATTRSDDEGPARSSARL